MDMNNVKIPPTSFIGNDHRKSSSQKRAMRIDKKVRIKHEDITRDIRFAIENMMKESCFRKFGEPVSFTPPGTVKAAAKTTVVIKAATIIHESAVFFF